MKKLLHKIKQNRTIVDIIGIFFIALLLAMPIFDSNNDVFFDDGSQHLMRAYGTYQSILQNGSGNVISDFTNGFGYSWNLFYGPLSTGTVIICSIILGGFNIGFKVVMLLILFLAGSFMYKFLYELTEQRNTAYLGAIIYITSPYFFTDLYIRHALGELGAFVFIPMVFLGLYNLFHTENNHYYLIFGAAGLILSHNISAVLTAIFAVIYCLWNGKNLTSTRVKKGLLLDFIAILLITSFYWMPFLETKFYTDYRVYEKDAMATQESFLYHTLDLKDLLITPNDTDFVFEIGLPVILMLVFSVMTFRRLEENKKEYLLFLIFGLISSWMATKYFPWKWLPECFYIIQFPWRMLVYTSFFFAIVASINMTTVIKKFQTKDVFIIGTICVLYIFSKYYMIPYSDIVPYSEQYEIMSVSGQNNEWLPGMGRLEYLPSRAYQNTFYLATRKPEILVMQGNCQIQQKIKKGAYMTVKIETQKENVLLELPFINYPGYTVRFDGMVKEIFETENGMIGCNIEADENGELEIMYTGTLIMNVSKIISMISFVLYLGYVWKKH